ncbi:MAG: NAD(P)-dependent oxidoreductase [Rhodobacteraceae bacterium]|nr:NAD(P)-dependent oxidoreductase [Paracoccaceae bacterium]
MKPLLVTGSSGHLGEAILRLCAERDQPALGLDLVAGPFTSHVADLRRPHELAELARQTRAVIHSATLHKPHVATHSRQDFVDTNVSATLALLEAARSAGHARFVFTSTTSAFGDALRPPPGAPAAWIDESVASVPKNIYGVTKTAAEDLCILFARRFGLPVTVLRTSRFFPEPDDDAAVRAAMSDLNVKAMEFLYRRVDLADAAAAHLDALRPRDAPDFERFVISAPSPFLPEDAARLRDDLPGLLDMRCPGASETFRAAGLSVPQGLGRVYDSRAARAGLGWRPAFDFARILDQIRSGDPIGSPLARAVGTKGYHGAQYSDGLYPVTPE